MIRATATIAALVVLTPAIVAQVGSTPPTTSIREIVRLEAQGRTQLRGMGIVVGLNGTGDAGTERPLARPLAEWYKNNGSPIENLEDLAKSRSAAVVSVTCEIPAGGARTNDDFDLRVSVLHSATSLAGGELILSPLVGPIPGQGVFAVARGQIIIEDPTHPTVGRVIRGGQLVRDIRIPLSKGQFRLIIEPPYAGRPTAQLIADEINGLFTDLEADDSVLLDPVAQARDEREVLVTIPEVERADPSRFIARILTKRFSPTLLDLPAQVVVNERTGSIIVTGDVEISTVSVTHEDLTITVMEPAPEAEGIEPRLVDKRWAKFGTTGPQRERSRIQDLLAAFEQLDVPTRDQIALLRQIHRTGRLYGQFIIDE